jgi:PAS domain S-box-containing protein
MEARTKSVAVRTDASVAPDGEQQAFLQNILESSTEYSIIGKDLTGKIQLWNAGARLVYGYDSDEVIGKANSAMLHTPEDIAAGKPAQIMAAALLGGKWEGTLTRVRKSGERFTARVVITPRRDETSTPIGFLLISKDISDEIRLAEELKATQFAQGEQSAFLQNILESSTEYSIIGKDLTGNIQLWNAGARRLYGYEAEEVIGKANSSMLHTLEDIAAGKPDQVLAAALNDGKWEGTINRVRKSGEQFTARVVITPRRDAVGKAIGFLLISKDISDEIRLTEELKATQFYARSLIEASLDPLVTISPEGKITDVNEGSIKVTGVPREKLIGTDFSDYFTEPDKAREGYERVFAEGFVTDYPLTIRHEDRRLTDVLYNASVYKDARGNVLGVFAAARDVTAQKQASQYARSLIEASLDPLVTISPEGKITDVNEGSIKVTGIPRENLIGTDFSNYFTEPGKASEGYQQVFSKGAVTDYPLTIRHKVGALTDVLYNASVYKDASGNVLGVFAAARDVTVQKQASQYARSLIEASLDPLVTISAEGKITDVNAASAEITGLAREKLIGTDFSDYFTEPEKAREGYKQVFEKGSVSNYPLTLHHRDGKLTDVLYNASVYKDPRGNVLGVFAAARDVTAQKKAEAEVAEQRTKELERLAELERFQRLTVGRELKMIELKKEIEELKNTRTG